MKTLNLLLIVVSMVILTNCKTGSDIRDNPLLADYHTPFEVPPFELIKPQHFLPALDIAIKEHLIEIDSIVNNKETPSFENTLVAFDRSGRRLKNVLSIFSGLKSADATEEIQKIAPDFEKKTSEHSDNIYLNTDLFKKIEAVYMGKDSMNLNTEQNSLLTYYYKRFIRNGVNLPDDKKIELREINQRLTELSNQFDQNLLAETNDYKLVLDKESQLEGLPEDVVNTSAETAKEMDLEGKWVFTTHKPSMIPFLQYSKFRDLRKKLYDAYCKRGNNNNVFDNKAIIAEMAKLRVRKAHLLGFDTYAAYELDNRMAQTPENVYKLLNRVWQAALLVAKQEREEMQEIVNSEGGEFKLASSDWWYYAEKLRNKKYNFDENELRPYLELNNVRDGVFTLCEKLYGLTFLKIENDFPKPHPDAEVFEVKDFDGSHLGILYLDYFTRTTKSQGAWCGTYREQYKINDNDVRPVVTIVCNYANPVGDAPVLLTLDDVLTLFHEFGHGLHQLLSDVTYEGISGTDVKRDFVELPSQIMENWATEPELMKYYARHYITNEPLPGDLINKIYTARYFNQGFATVEYVAASLLDMEYHELDTVTDLDIESFESNYLESIGLIPEIISRYRSTYFKHIWSGGYQAGYYSYIWAEVLDKDAFEAFREKGIFDMETAKAFRVNILEKGGSDDPMKLYIQFRGQEPGIEPLLKSRGLL